MVSSTDILEFQLGSYYSSIGNRGLNVFQYEITTTAPFNIAVNGQEVADAIYEVILDVLDPLVTTNIAYDHVTMKNLSDPIEVWDGTPTLTRNGTIASDPMPPFTAWGFKLTRTNASTRNGSKRFWGVAEADVAIGEPTAGVAARINAMSAFLGNPFTVTPDYPTAPDIELQPVICRKDATGALITSQPVVSASFRAVTTQNTRKFGRGM